MGKFTWEIQKRQTHGYHFMEGFSNHKIQIAPPQRIQKNRNKSLKTNPKKSLWSWLESKEIQPVLLVFT